MSDYKQPPAVCLDNFNGDNWVAIEAPQLLDSILLTPGQARMLAASLVAHAAALDGGGDA